MKSTRNVQFDTSTFGIKLKELKLLFTISRVLDLKGESDIVNPSSLYQIVV